MFEKEILEEQLKIMKLQKQMMLDEGIGSVIGGVARTAMNAAPHLAKPAALIGGGAAAGAIGTKALTPKPAPTTMQKVGGFIKDKAAQLGNIAKPYIAKAATVAKPIIGAARTALGV